GEDAALHAEPRRCVTRRERERLRFAELLSERVRGAGGELDRVRRVRLEVSLDGIDGAGLVEPALLEVRNDRLRRQTFGDLLLRDRSGEAGRDARIVRPDAVALPLY